MTCQDVNREWLHVKIRISDLKNKKDLIVAVLRCAYSLSHVQLFETPWTVAPQAPLSMGILQARILEPRPPPEDLPNPEIKPRSPTSQADSIPSEPPGKPKNTEVGSLFLLQGVFLTQELNRGLLYCRQIFYQLSYQASPLVVEYHVWECELWGQTSWFRSLALWWTAKYQTSLCLNFLVQKMGIIIIIPVLLLLWRLNKLI